MATPLADRLRPQTLEEVVGQRHLLAPGKVLRTIADSGRLPNLIFYGPSGVGKTTVARILAQNADMCLRKLNGTTATTADIKAVVEQLDTLEGANGILLYLDEIQYFNKRQQQTLLEYIENGRITLIASTTENPYFYVYNAILSRSTVFEFKSVEPEQVVVAIERAFAFIQKEQNLVLHIEDKVIDTIAHGCGGDVRKALNAVELCAASATLREDDGYYVTLERAQEVSQRSAMRYDHDGTEHFDIVSAYQKSMRGSDVNAALHYLARLLEAGDLPSACRRLLVCANEDVGLAYPQIIPIVQAAVATAQQVGLPEARLPLANAVVLVAQAPKSNSVHDAIGAAMADVQAGRTGPVPRQLQNTHYDGEDAQKKGQHYLYPHAYPSHWVQQQYLPDAIKDKVYYHPGDNKTEQAFAAYWDAIKGESR